MLKIRLTRLGAKKAPFYRIVVADARAPREGRPVDTIGQYDATKQPAIVNVDEEKALAWLAKGAQPTDTVRSLFKKQGVMQKFADAKKKLIERHTVMIELISLIAKSLVKQPDAVSVTMVQKGNMEVYELHVAPEDMGKVIGKQGRIAKAIRAVVKAAAIKENKKISVDIV